MPLLASSQTLSSDTLCSVPCYTLKNALLVKAERDLVQDKLTVSRDSIFILQSIISNQDTLISNQDSTISLYKDNEARYVEMLGNKEQIIGVKDKQIKKEKNKARLAWLTTALSVVGFILTL